MKDKLRRILKKTLIMYSFVMSVFTLIVALAIIIPNTVKAAEETITVKEIDYDKSTITFQLNSNDTKVFISDSSKIIWDEVIGDISSDRTIAMDISWITTSSNYVLNFKGDASTTVASIKIPKQDTKFKVSYNKVKESISFSNTDNRTIEWRKRDSRSWSVVNPATISAQLSSLYDNGATVVFRLASIKGTSNTEVGMRASKEVSVTVAKRTAAPTVNINGSIFTITVNKGMSYRHVTKDGIGNWIDITKNTKLLLSDIAPSALYKNDGIQNEVTIQFKKNATTSSQESKIATLIIPRQEGEPNVVKEGITITYTSSSTFVIKVKEASTKIPYEYTVVKEGQGLDYQNAKWNTISSNADVPVNNKTAPEGSRIYIRKKMVTESKTEEFKLASAAVEITRDSGITYPALPQLGTVTYMITSSGAIKASNGSSHKTFMMYSQTSTTVSSVDLYNSSGVKRGSVATKSTVAPNKDTDNSMNKYIITVTVTSTEEVDKYTRELLYAHITLANGDTIISKEISGVIFYLYPQTRLDNDSSIYIKDFKRVYLSMEEDDQKSFQFKLSLGTAYLYSTSVINQPDLATPIEISSIKLQDYSLKLGSDYSVIYERDDTANTATATVTIHVANFELDSSITKLDEALPLVISLNNKESIDSEVKITFLSTATIMDIPISWSITQGSLRETKTTTTTNADGTSSTALEDLNSYVINLNIFSFTYGVGVSDVTWGGQSIFHGATIKNGKGEITLSNKKINKLVTASSDTKDIVITFSNGFVIKKGIKLTIIKGSN